jgi:Transcriptional activator of glycolytic enzymes/Centromere DNA-binding protein complex CBF3 subunit, domain 2
MRLTNLLFYLWEVILQDSVVLRKLFPGNPIWNHPVFQHNAYTAFAQKVEACVQDKEHPSQLSILYQAMPLLADHLKAINARIDQTANRLAESIGQIAQSQSMQSTQLQLLTSGNLTFRLEAPPPPLLLPMPPLHSIASSKYTSAQASIVATPAARSPSPVLQGLSAQQQQERELLEPPKHRMCRAVRSVKALWQEWTVGLQGNPSIETLDRKWGNQWRAGRQSELQWYSLRLEVIKEIRRIAQAHRTSEEAAMQQVNLQQQQTKCSLDQFCKQLRASRKTRGK